MKPLFHIDPTDPMPIYAQLKRAIQFAVRTGTFCIGDQLPTVRQMAVDLRINANTVARVYAELEHDGIVETRRGIGTFIREQPVVATRKDGDPAALQRLAERFMAEAGALGFSPREVIDHLNTWFEKHW